MPSTDPDAILHVVAGVIRNRKAEVLLAQRQPGRHQAGKWEFPGGKREAGESAETALARELQEELGISVDGLRRRICVPYQYPDVAVQLDVYDVIGYSGDPHGREGQSIDWVAVNKLNQYDYPAANLPVLTSLALPDNYAISNVSGLGEKRFTDVLQQKLNQGLELLQLREPGMPKTEFRRLAEIYVQLVHDRGGRILLNTDDPGLVEIVGADGLHLNSRQLMALQQRPLPEHFLIAASCHDLGEMRQAEKAGVNFIVLGPVKNTASHPKAKPMGWEKFEALTSQCRLPVYALGGMSLEDIAQARTSGGQGVALLSKAWQE